MSDTSSAGPGDKVQILLATYNGAAYLNAQIDSILAQEDVSVHILARDDGSKDQTRSILEHYAVAFPDRFTLLAADAPSGGAKWNFQRLLAASDADYACLADQDDIWLPNKVSLSLAAMRRLEQQYGTRDPLLVFTDLKIVDDSLQEKAPSFWAHQNVDPTGIFALRRLLTQNVLTGCTALMNRRLVQLSVRMPEQTPMHDWWIALVACALGHAAIVPQQTILYRQHAANVLGAIDHGKPNLVPKFRHHALRRFEWEMTERQASAFLRIYREELSPTNRTLLEAYALSETSPNRVTRVVTHVRNRFFRNNFRHNLAILWYLWDMKAAKRADPGP